MRKFTTTISRRGQVTIPAEVRRALGVNPGDKVTFTIDGDEVRLKPSFFTLETVFGSVKPLNKPEDFDRIISEVKAGRAEQTVRELRSE